MIFIWVTLSLLLQQWFMLVSIVSLSIQYSLSLPLAFSIPSPPPVLREGVSQPHLLGWNVYLLLRLKVAPPIVPGASRGSPATPCDITRSCWKPHPPCRGPKGAWLTFSSSERYGECHTRAMDIEVNTRGLYPLASFYFKVKYLFTHRHWPLWNKL